jgi:DNA-binding response OmpR family regulator
MAVLMGLSVSLTSREGSGTSVRIDGLPVTQDPVLPRKPARALPTTLLDGMRVLLIEDDPNVLSATKTVLEKWGCRVRAERGMPADIGACDLVLADFDLNGGLNGADCIDRIRRTLGRDVPAIIMTGHDDGRVGAELGDATVPILSKPIRPAELKASLLAQRLRMDSDGGHDPARADQPSGEIHKPASTARTAAAAREETPRMLKRAET